MNQVRHRDPALGVLQHRDDLGSLNFDFRMTAPDAKQPTWELESEEGSLRDNRIRSAKVGGLASATIRQSRRGRFA